MFFLIDYNALRFNSVFASFVILYAEDLVFIWITLYIITFAESERVLNLVNKRLLRTYKILGLPVSTGHSYTKY